MNKLIKKVTTGVLTVITVLSIASTTAFASTSYVNSIGSAKEDIGILSDSSYTVIGKDATQDKKSTYSNITLADENITSPCEVYATVAEGSKVYDPENPNADDDGFVDGSIVASLPTTIILNGTPNTDGYYEGSGLVKVKGNIAGTTIVNVVPDSTVILSSQGKTDITANINQKYTKFVIPTSTVTGADVNKHLDYIFNDECSTIITIKTNQATAGSWSGSYNNTVSLSTAS